MHCAILVPLALAQVGLPLGFLAPLALGLAAAATTNTWNDLELEDIVDGGDIDQGLLLYMAHHVDGSYGLMRRQGAHHGRHYNRQGNNKPWLQVLSAPATFSDAVDPEDPAAAC